MSKLRWHGDPPSEQVANKTLRECEELLEQGLTAPHELIMHTVFLGKTMEGPSVFVWGDSDYPDEFQCEYRDVTVWETLDVLNEGPLAGKEILMPKTGRKVAN